MQNDNEKFRFAQYTRLDLVDVCVMLELSSSIVCVRSSSFTQRKILFTR